MKLSPASLGFSCRIALLCASCVLPIAGCVASDSAKTDTACNVQVIVRFKSDVDPTDTSVLSQIGFRIHGALTYGHSLGGDQHVLQLSSSASCDQAISALQHDQRVLNAEPDSMKRATH